MTQNNDCGGQLCPVLAGGQRALHKAYFLPASQTKSLYPTAKARNAVN